jgi:molybdenum cofactor guanylyltransferase
MIRQSVSAAVLAGGKSRRFGTDKALVPRPGGTTPMLEAVVQALLAVTADVIVIAPENRTYAQFGVPVVSERFPGQGPIGGLELALSRMSHDRCIVVACDLPFLNPDLLRWMAEHAFSEDALVPKVSGTADAGSSTLIPRPQPLHAIYRRSCLGAVQQLRLSGERRLGRLLDVIDVRYLEDKEIRRVDPELRSFLNLNSMEEWTRARRWLES